jgi:hypothetical protein
MKEGYLYHYLQKWSRVFGVGSRFSVGFPNSFFPVFLRVQILPYLGDFDRSKNTARQHKACYNFAEKRRKHNVCIGKSKRQIGF